MLPFRQGCGEVADSVRHQVAGILVTEVLRVSG